MKSSIIIFLIAIIMLMVGWYGIRLLRMVLAPMKEGKPFETGIPTNIRRLAWVTLIGGGTGEICKLIGSTSAIKAYDLSLIFSNTSIANITINYIFGCGFIVIAVVLFLLSYIFRYGESLQQESDETL